MKVLLSQIMLGALIVLGTLVVCATDAEAQRRRRPSRRVTNPVPAQTVEPQTTDAEIISTAEERAGAETSVTSQPRRRQGARSAPETERERLERTVDALSAQVTQMSAEMRRMQQEQRTLISLERLTRAEERAENMRAQLRDVTQREFDLQARAEAIEYELQPDSLERRMALTGARRPEEMREQFRRQLESERVRVRAQLTMLTANRARLESAIATADTEVERVRVLVNEPSPNIAPPTEASGVQAVPTQSTAEPSAPTTTPPTTAPPVPF